METTCHYIKTYEVVEDASAVGVQVVFQCGLYTTIDQEQEDLYLADGAQVSSCAFLEAILPVSQLRQRRELVVGNLNMGLRKLPVHCC